MRIDFRYDAWGNMTSKTRGSYTAAYGWHYGGKLTAVTSNFPGEGAVAYAYGGDGKRRGRTAGGLTTGYNYDLGWNLLNEEDGTGALTTTFIHAPQGAVGPVLADVAGGNPAAGAYRYYALDHLGSTNGLYDGAKAKVAALAYTPYGASYGDVGPAPLPRYTGHLWDGAAGLHLAPYRAYAPTLARWLSRDPLGMVDGPNLKAYALSSPVMYMDELGLYADTPYSCWEEGTPEYDRCWWRFGSRWFFRDGCGVKYCCIKRNQDKCDKCWEKFTRAISLCGAPGSPHRKTCIDKATAKLTACWSKYGCI